MEGGKEGGGPVEIDGMRGFDKWRENVKPKPRKGRRSHRSVASRREDCSCQTMLVCWVMRDEPYLIVLPLLPSAYQHPSCSDESVLHSLLAAAASLQPVHIILWAVGVILPFPRIVCKLQVVSPIVDPAVSSKVSDSCWKGTGLTVM